MKACSCQSNECIGKVERFSIYSPEENTIYPNRFWGVVDYCELHKKDDIQQGFILNTSDNQSTFVL